MAGRKRKRSRLVEAAAEHLDAGEGVLASVAGVYQGELLGADIPRNGVLVATERRLMFYGRRLGGYDIESFPYENISSFEQGRNVYGSYVHLYASGNRIEMKWIADRHELSAVLGVVEARMGYRYDSHDRGEPGDDPGVPQPAAATDVPQRLRELARLHQEGILTSEEFARKKEDLLRRF